MDGIPDEMDKSVYFRKEEKNVTALQGEVYQEHFYFVVVSFSKTLYLPAYIKPGANCQL